MRGQGPAASGYVLLEDGARLEGDLCGDPSQATGEVVFNTAMAGYQESVTDPSYAGQIVTFTYPLIGNYGVCEDAMESDRVHARAVIMRDAKNRTDAATAEGGWLDWLAECGVPAITGVDTRALVRHIREQGSMRGGIFGADVPESEARERIAAEPQMAGSDLAQTVTPAEPIVHEGPGPHIVAIDTGIKRSIIRQLLERGCKVTLLPCGSSPADVLAQDPDLVFLANGPGDPAALDYVVETVRELVGKKPVFGICLGHQLLCRAVGLETFKLPFGHRGANHPVKDLEHRQDRDHLPEPWLRGRRAQRRKPDGDRRADPLGDRLRRRRALPPEPLRPHGRGPQPARRPRRDRPVPPRGRPGPARRKASVRRLFGAGEMRLEAGGWRLGRLPAAGLGTDKTREDAAELGGPGFELRIAEQTSPAGTLEPMLSFSQGRPGNDEETALIGPGPAAESFSNVGPDRIRRSNELRTDRPKVEGSPGSHEFVDVVSELRSELVGEVVAMAAPSHCPNQPPTPRRCPGLPAVAPTSNLQPPT